MEENFASRTAMLLGHDGVEKLKNSHVLVVGLGGVGSFTVEALARAGVGRLTLCDHDRVSLSNLNRQLCALRSTVGQYKTQVLRDRIADINPECQVTLHTDFLEEANAKDIIPSDCNFIVDAIDSVASKTQLICYAHKAGISIVSAMGTGNKLDPSRFRIVPIEKTSVCPLARVMRRRLKDAGIQGHMVLFSDELPVIPPEGGSVPGSVSFVPSCAGLMLAGYVIRRLTQL